MKKLTCAPENAQKFSEWINTRGGIAVWHSADLGNPGRSWSTPLRNEDGSPAPRPHWSSESKPREIITDPADVSVIVDKELKRFHVGIKRANGYKFELTSASSRRLREAVAKAGTGAYHVFDYEMQDAIIMVPESEKPLLEFIGRKGVEA